MQTNQFAKAISSIPGIVDKYINNRMNEAVKVGVQLLSDRLRDEAQAENEDFLNKLNENIKKIIKEQVKAQIYYAVAANLSELELRKILIDKMESNKSIHIFDEQKNLYKALVDAYECDKLILDTYGDTVTLKRHRDDEDKDEEPSAGSNRGNLARKDDSRTSFNELMDTPLDFSAFVMNRLKVDTLTPELIVGDYNRLRIQDIEDMLLLLVQGKLTNLTVDERLAFDISLRMFTSSVVIQRRMEDLQLGVESYQKKINLTKPDTYRSDLKRKEAYTAYSNPRGFIYHNKDKQNILMRIDE
nr:hypothetical protein [Tanacetum cinerariifolium]